MKAKQPRKSLDDIRAARVEQLRKSARATVKATEATPCAVIRALSAALPKTGRREFQEAFTHRGAGFIMAPATVDRQFYLGRR